MTRKDYSAAEGGKTSGKYRTTVLNCQADVDWALETHVGRTELKGQYRFAVLYGNEDCPDQIEFWEHDNPGWDWKANFSWSAKP